jgi:heme exporter protein D
LYLVGYNITEELVKFGFFVLAILLLKPVTTRRVLYTGMLIGAGFATVEHFTRESVSWYIFPLRVAGHMLFTSVIALWYSLGSFARMRWIDDGAQSGVMPFLLSKWPGVVMILWVITGIFLAAFFHSFVNLFASAGHYMAVVIEAVGWAGVVLFLLNHKSQRPYGRILQEIKLMQELHDIQETLNTLQRPQGFNADNQQQEPHFQIKKMRLSRKQVAKK